MATIGEEIEEIEITPIIVPMTDPLPPVVEPEPVIVPDREPVPA